jgi:hypothetical protein
MGSGIMASFNIKNFKAEINKSGVLHTNKFEVSFKSPLVLQNISIDGINTTDTEKLINLRAENVKIPGIGLLMTDVNRYGVGSMQKMPYSAAFTSNAITFLTDRPNSIHKYFYSWVSLIFDAAPNPTLSSTDKINTPTASYVTEYKDNYTTDITIKVYDNFGNKIQEIVMFKAFPEALNDVNLNWNDNNNLMKIGVSFSFRDWTMVNLNIGNPAIPAVNNKDIIGIKDAGAIAYAAGTDSALTSTNKEKVTPATTDAKLTTAP